MILRSPQYDWDKLLGMTRQELLAEYRAARLSRYDGSCMDAKRREIQTQRFEEEAVGLLVQVPTPERFKACKNIRTFAWADMTNGIHGLGLEDDPDSVMARACVSRGEAGKEEGQHDLSKPFAGGLYPDSFGIYSPYDKSSSETIRTGVPQDEKYHWYRIKAWEFRPNSFLWSFYWIARVDLTSAWANADGLPGYNTWETWFSVKYTGPAYVKGSQQKNGVFIDQVVLVKPDEPAE